MRTLVTGSAGHLGEGLVRVLLEAGHEVVGVDIRTTPYTTHVGSIADRDFVRGCMAGVKSVFHVATLHKPHLVTHSRQQFIDTNVTGTLNLLEEAADEKVGSFVFASTTSMFGDALSPSADAPAVWVTEELFPIPKNIYGVTKAAAEDLCYIFHRNRRLPCIVLRTGRFFPDEDDDREMRDAYADANLKVNESLFRRVDIEDVVVAHLLAAQHAPALGFRTYIVVATTPFTRDDLGELRQDAPAVVRRRVPEYEAEYRRLGWKMFPSIGRVYVNERAHAELGWEPRYDFRYLIEALRTGGDLRSPLARAVGSKPYHEEAFADGRYPVEKDAPPSTEE